MSGDRPVAEPGRDQPEGHRRADHRDRQHERGEEGSRSTHKTGALPVKFVTVERTDVSATLGKDSLNQAKKNAAIGGLIIVALFLLLFYRFLGLVAVLGLGIYAAFMYAAILLFHVTLTLPGFGKPDPDDRRRGERERRHIRTHKGRSLAPVSRCARRSPRVTPRASARSST